jgi:predicted dehydrogenase
MSEGTDRNSRREFLKTSTTATVAAGLASSLIIPQTVHAAGTDETLRIGLIGCGGRGQGAVKDALAADANAKLVAVGDTFKDRADDCLNWLRGEDDVKDRIAVDEDHVFTDFDNFKKVADSEVDVVILATPPHFRPEHLEYVVQAGKHCFCEKPVAVDAPGLHRSQAACELAEAKGLSIVSGLMMRYDAGTQATVEKVHEGAIGDIIAIQSSYNAGTLWHRGDKPDWSRMEYQIRNWLYYTWLSGDHVVEQAVHSLDRSAWLLGDTQPLRAVGMGGRQQRTDEKWGQIFDHHSVVLDFPNEVKVFFTCRQQDNVKNEVEEHVLGTKGQCALLRNRITGENPWRNRERSPSGYRVEHDELFAAIRNGTPINNGHYMCNSTMIAIMARMAAYTGKELTWDDCVGSTETLGPESYAWGEAPNDPVPIPGVTSIA